ncbi:hypothetical protein WJX74_010187 [Apatococcus lobatus]|uniref:FAD-binding PCMH-type domain-containing protein n=1 Tax=Apatococcus lobatus TaxID=904363 RepID=A0AAW1RQD1_9CHLO
MDRQAHPVHTIFSINGETHELDSTVSPSLSLSEYLKRFTPFKGKISCSEGGCGACSVEIIKCSPEGEHRRTALNACLAPVGTLDGASVHTSESLGNQTKGFSPIQEQFARHHASQCGFCTPGFVVAIDAHIKRCKDQGKRVTLKELQKGIDGNLCRCTGYAPIIKACKALIDAGDVEDLAFGLPCTGQRPGCQQTCHSKEAVRHRLQAPRSESPAFHRPTTFQELFAILHAVDLSKARFVAGNTGSGVYKDWPTQPTLVELKHIPQLRQQLVTKESITVGAAVTLEEVIHLLASIKGPAQAGYAAMVEHMERIAGHLVRAAATVGGNVVLARQRALQSDYCTIMIAAGADVEVTSRLGARWVPLHQFADPSQGSFQQQRPEIVSAVRFPALTPHSRFWSYKVAARFNNAHAMVNTSIWMSTVSQDASASSPWQATRVAIGCPTKLATGKVEWRARRAFHVEAAIRASPANLLGLVSALEALPHDINPGDDLGASAGFCMAAAEGMVFRTLAPFVAAALPEAGHRLQSPEQRASLQRLLAAPPPMDQSVPLGQHEVPDWSHVAPPVHLPVEKDRIRLQASGEARYTGDMMLDGAELYAYVVKSARALATITSVDPSAALQVPGVLKYISASDIPKGGINGSVHGSIQPEPLFATDRVIYQGQPIGLIVAESPSLAERACDLVRVEYGPDGELGDPIITLEDAIAKSSFFEGPALVGGSAFRKRSIGNATAALQAAPHTITDASYMLPSQQHMYMEPHVSVAEPDEDGTISVWSSTQSPDACQKAVADVLGLPYHNVRVRTRRVGGAFGGKVTRPCQIAAGAALAAWKLGRKVHLAITRDDDLRMNGGRNPTKVLYSVGFQPDGRITALDIRGWMQCGALLDLAFNDAGVLQAKADQAYAFPNMSVDIKLCRCNIAPKTIVRGPGFLNAALVAEHILEHVAQHLDLDPVVVRERNFLTSLAELPHHLPSADEATAAGPPGQPERSTNLATESVASPSSASAVGASMRHADGDGPASPSIAPPSVAQTADAAKHDQRDRVVQGSPPHSTLQSQSGVSAVEQRNMSETGLSSQLIRRGYEHMYNRIVAACCPRPPKSLANPPQPSSGIRRPGLQGVDEAAVHWVPAAASPGTPAATPDRLHMVHTSANNASASLKRPPPNAVASLPLADVGARANTVPGNSRAAERQAASTKGSAENTASNCAQHLEAAAAGRVVSRPCQPDRRIAPADDVLRPGDVRTPLGTHIKAGSFTLWRVWDGVKKMSNFYQRRAEVQEFNSQHAWRKRGIALSPVRFDVAPAAMPAAVTIYADGSVLVSHGGIEMGQGLATKVKQVAAFELGKLLPAALQPLPMELVRIGDTDTAISPNGGPTWSSTGSESTCAAVQEACKQLRGSLAAAMAGVSGASAAAAWRSGLAKVHGDPGIFPATVLLSAYGFFDGTQRGRDGNGQTHSQASASRPPMSYTLFAAACTEVEIDVLTGEHFIRQTDIFFDCGRSLNPMIDMGQVEGAFVFGLGMMTTEEVVVDPRTGRLLTDSTWTYKIPTAPCVPSQFNVSFLKDSPNEHGVMSSKACGEPSLMLVASILAAMRQAVAAAHSDPALQHTSSLPLHTASNPAAQHTSPQPHLAATVPSPQNPAEQSLSNGNMHSQMPLPPAPRTASADQGEDERNVLQDVHVGGHDRLQESTDMQHGTCPGSCQGGSTVQPSNSFPGSFLGLEAPATVARVRDAIGGPSIAAVLRNAAGLQPAELCSTDDWELI